MRTFSPVVRVLAACLLAVAAISVVPSPARAGQEPAPDPLVIVVNRQNPVETLSGADLRRIFLGERLTWPDRRRMTVVMRPPEDPERALLLRLVCRMSEPEYVRHLLQASFVGDASAGPKQLSTAAGVRRFIFNVPGAIGYLRVSEVDDSVKVVRVDNRPPSDAAYPLRGEGR